jgi:SecD/SecF fusion protein
MDRSVKWLLILFFLAVGAALVLLRSEIRRQIHPETRPWKVRLSVEADLESGGNAEPELTMDRVEAVIRQRVSKFGLPEPVITREPPNMMEIELTGIRNQAFAVQMIGRTCLLEFKLVREADELREMLAAADAELTATPAGAPHDAENAQPIESKGGLDPDEDTGSDCESCGSLLRLLSFAPIGNHEDAFVFLRDKPVFEEALQQAREGDLIPPDVEILWGDAVEERREGEFERIYLVDSEAALTGSCVKNAKVKWGLDSAEGSAPGIVLELYREGLVAFARITGENIDRRLAIVIDGRVHSAPNITEKIMGKVAITGRFTPEEARDLATMLEAGALPVPLRIVDMQTSEI